MPDDALKSRQGSPKSRQKGLKAKAGPLPVWGWAAVAAGGFVIYRYIRNRQSAAASTAASGTTGGTTIPTDLLGTSTSSTPTTYDTLAEWEQAAISQLSGQGLGGADAANAIGNWLNGTCVSASVYNQLSGVITTTGLPPGYDSTTLPALTVCPSTNQTPTTTTSTTTTSVATSGAPAPSSPPNLPTSLIAAMTNNGESIVDTQWNSVTQEWIYLTNKGGIYTLGPQGQTSGVPFYGSIFDLPAGTFAGRTAVKLTINPDGGYTVTDQNGENYTFSPSQDWATGSQQNITTPTPTAVQASTPTAATKGA